MMAAEEPAHASSESRRWKMLPKRRHSIQVVPPRSISTKPVNSDDDTIDEGGENEPGQLQVKPTSRRQSITESLQHMTKSVSR
jgi:hypothetical protein